MGAFASKAAAVLIDAGLGRARHGRGRPPGPPVPGLVSPKPVPIDARKFRAEPPAPPEPGLPKFIVDAILSREYSLAELRMRFGVEPGDAMRVRAGLPVK